MLSQIETDEILNAYNLYIKEYGNWWKNKDNHIAERRFLLLEPHSIEKIHRITKLEIDAEELLVKFMKARLDFYAVLSKNGFHSFKIRQWLNYTITRKEDGIDKSYDINRDPNESVV